MTDAQWAVIEPLLPRPAAVLGGRSHVYSRRLIIDTISYVLVSGCAWRLVPHDLAPWSIAYQWFRAWTGDGTWDGVHEVLRDRVRAADGRDPQPSAGVLDSQSAKSSEGGEAIGYDAGKRVRGRKRHLLVDTIGLLLHVVVHSASVQDRAGAQLVLAGARRRFPLLGLVWVDGGYVNSVDAGLVGWAEREEGIEIVAVPRNADVKGFQVLPRRWVVERTFGWLTRCGTADLQREALTVDQQADHDLRVDPALCGEPDLAQPALLLDLEVESDHIVDHQTDITAAQSIREAQIGDPVPVETDPDSTTLASRRHFVHPALNAILGIVDPGGAAQGPPQRRTGRRLPAHLGQHPTHIQQRGRPDDAGENQRTPHRRPRRTRGRPRACPVGRHAATT